MLSLMAAKGGDIEALARTCKALLDETRAQVAAGQNPDPQTEPRLRALFDRARRETPDELAEIDRIERGALEQLERVLSVRRARALVARRPAHSPEAATPSRPLLRTRPTITGNMEVRRDASDGRFMLAWDAAAAVTSWEVRFSERENPRGAYVVRETLALPASQTTVELPLAEHALQVHVLGRSRDGRLLRRAVISALTREGWNERWQRRASAS
jgi:hypothetical protein